MFLARIRFITCGLTKFMIVELVLVNIFRATKAINIVESFSDEIYDCSRSTELARR